MSKNHQYTQDKIPIDILKRGDILAFHNHGFFSKLIQFYTDSYWNHVALVSQVYNDGDVAILESSGHGVQPNLLRNKKCDDITVLRPAEYSSLRGFAAIKAAMSLGPSTYDRLQLVKFVTRRFFKRSYRRDDKLICSELVAEAWKVAGVDLFPSEKPPSPASIVLLAGTILRRVWGPKVN